MDNSLQNSSNGIDNISMSQNYHDELSKLNNAKVFRNLENGSLHLIAVHREEDSMIDGAFLNSQNLLANSIIVGHNGIGSTQTLIDGQYTVNFIDEHFQINEQQVNPHGNEIQLQPAIFQMVNTKMVNHDGQSVMFPAHNAELTSGSRRVGPTNLKDLATLTPISQDIQTDDFKQPFQNISLPPLTPIRKLKSSNTRSPKIQDDSRIKIEPSDNGYVTQGQIICSLPPTSLEESSNIQLSVESRDKKGDLPHKKRITKKMKKHPKTQPKNIIQVASNSSQNDHSTTKFSCQLCNSTIYGQLDFFAHLKEHYEPNNIVACNSGIEQTIATHALNQVPEVENNFENNTSILYTAQQDNIVQIHPMDSDLKPKLEDDVEARDIDVIEQDDDAEFSDADDMFEGIQNVVNKVQDGSDWYDEEEFQATMSFKPGILDDDDMDVIVEKEDSSESEPAKPDVTDSSNNILASTENDNETEKDKEEGNKNGDKPWAKCLICDKRFKSKNAYQYHETTHSGVRPHQCEDCGKCFSTIGALRIHSRLHSGVRPYKCRFCERPFRQWGDMKYHITSIHTNEKKYQCEFCGKGFARRYSLVVHRRIHTGERNYRCEFCDKTFRASSYLVNHRRIHTGEKPHECSICEKKFRVRSDMKRHMNIHTRPSTRASRKPQVSNKKAPCEEQAVSLSSDPLPIPVVVSIKSEHVKKESNGPGDSSDVIYADQNIEILRKVLLTEKAASSNQSIVPTDSVNVKKEEPADF